VQGSDGICSAIIKRVSTSFDSLGRRDLKETVVRVERNAGRKRARIGQDRKLSVQEKERMGYRIKEEYARNSLFAMQPFEPSDGCLALRKLMANGSNG
jgi:hypothetical protein